MLTKLLDFCSVLGRFFSILLRCWRAVHTPSGPQQLATMDHTQFRVVALKAFLKSKGLSQQGRKADLIARLKKYQEDHIKNMEDGTYAHAHVRRRMRVCDENRAASSTDRPAAASSQPFTPPPRAHDALVCRYGVECTRADCTFKHPFGRLTCPEGETPR